MVEQGVRPSNPSEAHSLALAVGRFRAANGCESSAHLDLEGISRFWENRASGGRVFTLAVEVEVQVACLEADLQILLRTQRSDHAPRLLPGAALDAQLVRFRANSNIILRYRAIWDKLLGLYVLLCEPAEYEQFLSAKSRRKKFAQLMRRNQGMGAEGLAAICQALERFDALYRTGEAHGTGSTRIWVSDRTNGPNSRQAGIMWAWNDLNHVLKSLAPTLLGQGAP